jgi:uncharacterized cupredoxin-like copper-binding protein
MGFAGIVRRAFGRDRATRCAELTFPEDDAFIEEVMMNRFCGLILAALLGAACLALPSLACISVDASAHEGHEQFAAGEPGDPKKPFRVVKVAMAEDGKKLLFKPAMVEVRRGEQIRFEIFNEGTEDHEFMLATEAANRKHAELMKRFPDMQHEDPNAVRLSPFASGSILWKFTTAGTFEYACLIPGHREAGMYGTVTVK